MGSMHAWYVELLTYDSIKKDLLGSNLQPIGRSLGSIMPNHALSFEYH